MKVGERFGRWVVIGTVGKRALCQCDCGTVKDRDYPSLRYGRSMSCGCIRMENIRLRTAESSAMRRAHRREWETWCRITGRCKNPNVAGWHNYGGRGIQVCARWAASFEDFFADMGPRPDGCSIDRIDVDGNYEPTNCRWATGKQQSNNKRTNHVLTYQGRTLSVAEWASAIGLTYSTLLSRLQRGWTTERALASG